MPWETIAILELMSKLPVIATVIYEASPNRKFYGMHEQMNDFDDSSV